MPQNTTNHPLFAATQRTLKSAIHMEGIGLHSGKLVTMRLLPAPAGTGIIFQRTDMNGAEIPASYALVSETMLGTVIQNADGAKVQTIEHLMSALWGLGVDNVIVQIDAPEVPIVDGSALPFIEAIAQTGVTVQREFREYIEVVKPVRLTEGESEATLLPNGKNEAGFVLDVVVEYPHPAIARQSLRVDFLREGFASALGYARTFGFEADIQHLRKLGMTLGGSLDNAIVLGKDGILNSEPLRAADEFVRHKMLDCVGDFFLAHGRILGQVVAKRPGHRVNNLLLRALFADPTAFRMVRGDKLHVALPKQTTTLGARSAARDVAAAAQQALQF
jgi:UDP-3-O-[3-hydroxymyristoyl] N-acetylglucosamine deacetylase